MSEAVIIPIVAGLIGCIPGIMALWSQKKRDKLQALKDDADRELRKDEVENDKNSTTVNDAIEISKAAMAMIKPLSESIKSMEAEQLKMRGVIVAQEEREKKRDAQIQALEEKSRVQSIELERQKVLIRCLMTGIGKLIDQIKSLKHEPVWTPDLLDLDH